MIYIRYSGSKVLAEDNGTPVSPPKYWLDDPDQTILKGLAAAYALGEGVGWERIPDPTEPEPEPDWLGFNTEMFLDKDWSSYINPPMLMAAATSAALSRDVAQLHYCLELAYQTVGEPSEAARTRWNNLAKRFHIGVTF